MTAQKFRGRRAAAAAALAVMALGATGCAAINQQATTLQYDASDGVGFSVGGLQARNMLAKVCSLDLHPASFPVGVCSPLSWMSTAFTSTYDGVQSVLFTGTTAASSAPPRKRWTSTHPSPSAWA